jgi:PAS domain-containing protein
MNKERSLKKKPANSPDAAEMRRQAETMLNKRKNKASAPPATEAETLRLVHELEVHQIELEMQNEQLRQAHEESEVLQRRYFDLYDLAPVGYLTVNEKGTILQANLTAAKMLGREIGMIVNHRLPGFIVREDQDIYHLFHK